MKKLILLSIFSLFALMGFAQINVSVAEAKALIKKEKKLLIIDVRTPQEFAAGNIKGAKLVDYYNANFKAEINKLNKNRPVLLYCRSGRRSAEAMQIMTQELGFKKVYNMLGGFNQWGR